MTGYADSAALIRREERKLKEITKLVEDKMELQLKSKKLKR